MYRHGKSLNTYYYVKEVSPKRLHTIRFQLFDILEKKENYRDSKKYRWLWRWRKAREGEGWTGGALLGSETILYDIVRVDA